MASPELFVPTPKFQEEIVYTKPNLRPSVITRATSNIFSLYFSEHLNGKDLEASKIILGDALEFIHNARSGLANNIEDVDHLGLANPDDKRFAQSVDGGPTVPDDEERETLRFALLTMGAMPRLATVHFIDQERAAHEFRFTQRGMLAPPVTLREAAGRLRELWKEIIGVAAGNTDPKIHIIHNQSTLRAKLFFDIGKQIAVA